MILIAYFSLNGETYVDGHIENRQMGNTEVIARKVQTLTGGDMFHIETTVPYPADYYAVTDVVRKELRSNARPELAGRFAGIARYDTIVLGYPNWWGTMPMAVCTFLESYDFSEKTIIPYCTNEGSGLGRSVRDIRRLCPDAVVAEGVAIRGGGVAHADIQVEQIVRQVNRY